MSASTGPPRGGRSIPRFPTPKRNGSVSTRCLGSARLSRVISQNAAVPSARLGLDRVVAFARLGLQVFVCQLDFEPTVAAVLHIVEGRVPDGILAAHLF